MSHVTMSDLWQLLKSISLRLQTCTFVVDGFDECDDTNKTLQYHIKDGHAKFLQELINLLEGTGSHLLLISRNDAKIRSQL